MAEIITSESKLITAYGHSGTKAAALSDKRKASENSVKMNAKMMAEVFRLYGWVAPATREKSYPVRFTLLGQCAATNAVGANELLKQAALGYVSPNENMQNGKATEHVRFFPFVLKTMHALGGYLYKHEMCMGPMSTDDTDQDNYERMLITMRQNRKSFQDFESAFDEFCHNQKMKRTSVDNLTRLPISLLTATGWVQSESTKEVFSVNRKCLKLTGDGLAQLNEANTMYDMRLAKFRQFDREKQDKLIRVGLYGMLLRAGFVLEESQHDQLKADSDSLDDILEGKELLFSPYQTINASEVDKAIGITPTELTATGFNKVDTSSEFALPTFTRTESITTHEMVNSTGISDLRDSAGKLAKNLQKAFDQNHSVRHAAATVFKELRAYKQKEFYPLVADLFSIIGFPCQESRAGDNGARWDAIIVDDEESIPIEIKSPTEEEFLSLKGVRQALENKVILLSRNTYPTKDETTSITVGYNLPNSRAEVSELIENFYNSYHIRLGVIGLEALLQLAIESVVNARKPKKPSITRLKGILNIDIETF